ncbi:MAG: alpha-amylase/4-alpha-glucanotransferase domain-containing protein [Promethearchaeota archaeon]
MEKTIYLPIVFHFHQPIDNFGWVYEDCFQKSYGPLIDAIYEHPKVKVTLHFSGNLLEWFIENQPDFIKKLKEMAKHGQIEIIGGGYYEPIFGIIPKRDKIAQVKKLSDLINQEFALQVKGAWLSERVWEPNYPSFLSEVGLQYVIVDDNHFRSTGLTEEDTLYTYITEDEGSTLRVFPINEPLRYLMPWKPTFMAIDYLKKVADENGDRVCLFISDAEKMGVWGSTHQICYVEGKGHEEGDEGKPFIPAFLKQIEKNSWIKSITCSEYIKKFPARSLVYLPTASYDKMEEWVLPTKIRTKFKTIRKKFKDDPEKQDEYLFLKGGFWRSFLVKYPESNNMHKKMLYVRDKLIHIEELFYEKYKEKPKALQSKIDQAWDEIYKAQCNDCYWHGMFGGIYLHFLRFSVYTHLLNAENIIDEMRLLLNPAQEQDIIIRSLDFNKDSRDDILIESNLLNLYFNLADGGTLFELDYKPKSYNLLNTLTRWPEAYHEKEKIKKEDVKIDRYRRSMLRIRFFHDDVSIENLHSDTYYEFGNFVDGEFSVKDAKVEEKTATLKLEMKGSIKDPDTEDRIPCIISKTILIEENKVLISIKGNFSKENPLGLARIIRDLYIGIDLPFFFNGDMSKATWETTQYNLETEKVKDILNPCVYDGADFQAYDETYDLTYQIMVTSSEGDAKLFKFPIIAYAFTDEGYKEIYQGINVLTRFKINKTFDLQIELKIS